MLSKAGPNVPPAVQCRLCAAIADASNLGGARHPENTLLIETPHFIVVPALGPLTFGHILVISKRHVPSAAVLSKAEDADLDKLLTRLARNARFGSRFLEFEHGSTDNESGGASVIHAHIHWLPMTDHLISVPRGLLPKIPVKSRGQLRGYKGPYIYLRSAKTFDAYEAPNLCSQYLRRLLAKGLGSPTIWNWRRSPRMRMIHETIRNWQEK